VKPANQLGSMILIGSTQGFTAGIVLGKFKESVSLRPLSIEARILIILLNPSNVRCYYSDYIPLF
jgi:hypothetical protein